METSDSDYFESADEEFSSGDDNTETDNSAPSVTKKLKEKISSEIDDKSPPEKVKIGSTSVQVTDVKEDVQSTSRTTLTQNLAAVQIEETENERSTNSPSILHKKSSEDSRDSDKREERTRHTFDIPPAKDVCSGNIVHTRNIVVRSSENDLPVSSKSKRPEFGIPPRRVECWIEGVSNVSKRAVINTEEQKCSETEERKNLQTEECESSKTQEQKCSETDNHKSSEMEERKCSDIKDVEERTSSNKHNIERNAEGAEENMWNDDEGWGEIEPNILIESDSRKPNETEKNMWDDDDWEPIDGSVANSKPKEDEAPKSDNSGWGGWTTWGLSTVFSTASTLTSQVSQSLGTVLETGIGVPEPEELARIDLEKQNQAQGETKRESEQSAEQKPPVLGFRFGNLVQGVTQITKLVETTGSKVITGGLDTLETIGKKTMEVLQENDPGLKKKRAFLKLDDDKPILSQVLREAKEKAEAENAELEQKHFARKANYEMLFDDHQGLVHLEALEMLSRQCDIKLQTILEGSTGDALVDMQETIDQVKELCELPDEDDEDGITDDIVEKLSSATSEINVNITYDHLITKWRDVECWLSTVDSATNSMEVHRQAIEALAQLTAIAVERFHKTGELLLIKERRSTADEADSLVQLTTILTALIGVVAARFSEKLNVVADKEVNGLITNVFFEAANSSSYIQDAFQLLIPVIQVGALSL